MKKKILFALAMLAVSTGAVAHPGHGVETGFTAGWMHPLTGWDHLLVMLALGIWSARRPQGQGWQLPVLFVVAMTVSALIAMQWLPVSLAEWLVAFSVLVMGGLLLADVTVSRGMQLGGVAVIASAHGYLHGLELSHHWAALAGMVMATALLHALGWVLGRYVPVSLQYAIRLLGGVMLGLGTFWLLA